jgi:hypothetical protein
MPVCQERMPIQITASVHAVTTDASALNHGASRSICAAE